MDKSNLRMYLVSNTKKAVSSGEITTPSPILENRAPVPRQSTYPVDVELAITIVSLVVKFTRSILRAWSTTIRNESRLEMAMPVTFVKDVVVTVL